MEASKIKVVYEFKNQVCKFMTNEVQGRVNGVNGSIDVKSAHTYDGSVSLLGKLWSVVSSTISWAFQYIE